jgi:hypothetical protein
MRYISIAVACGVGIVVLADFFFTHPLLDLLGIAFREWAIILTAFAMLLGIFNVLSVHIHRLIKRDDPGRLSESGAGYSVVVLISAALVGILGLIAGLPSPAMTWIFENVYSPVQSALFALLAFFVATAAYRALRARNIETLLMLAAALVVLIGQTPWLNMMSEAKDWILRVPAAAGVRGILIGVALGTIATGLRLLVGLDRPYSE